MKSKVTTCHVLVGTDKGFNRLPGFCEENFSLEEVRGVLQRQLPQGVALLLKHVWVLEPPAPTIDPIISGSSGDSGPYGHAHSQQTAERCRSEPGSGPGGPSPHQSFIACRLGRLCCLPRAES